MNLLIFLFATIWPFSNGKPVENVVAIIENTGTRNAVAWQKTGEEGKISIAHLDAGNYRILIELPYLDGKWIKTKRRHRVMTKASYNPKNKTYYYQGKEGFFSVTFKGIRRIESENFKPVFREIKTDNGFQYVIANFQTLKDGAQISLFIKMLTAAQFKSKVEKIDHDISMMSIPDFN